MMTSSPPKMSCRTLKLGIFFCRKSEIIGPTETGNSLSPIDFGITAFMVNSLDNSFQLQWSTKDDIDRLCYAMEPVFQPPGLKLEFISYLVHDQYKRWAFGESSLMTAEDAVFATDKSTKDNKIVAFTTLWQDQQMYNGICFSIGRVEFVGVVPEYRNRGLMPRIMDAVHEASDKRGDLMQTIVGIPYYYRQFGYEYALDIGKRTKTWLNSIPHLHTGESELATPRAATLDDIDTILSFDRALSLQSCNYAPLRREYLETQIKGSINSTASQFQRRVAVFEQGGQTIGYFIMHNFADPSAISVLQTSTYLPSSTVSYAVFFNTVATATAKKLVKV
jgi:GNAT superfamily N-acetyltransferase